MTADLERLKIDRGSTKSARTRRPSRVPWLGFGAVGVVVVVGVLFRGPLMEFVDQWRLPTVETVRVRTSHPAAVGAVQGKAANGYIVASRRAALSADTPGRIVELKVTEGSVMKEGDLVARLYPDEFAAALTRADAEVEVARASAQRASRELSEAQVQLGRAEQAERVVAADAEAAQTRAALAGRERQRVEQLLDRGIASEQELDQAVSDDQVQQALVTAAARRLDSAKADVDVAQARVEVLEAAAQVAAATVTRAEAEQVQAAATLSKTEVRAPFDGIVVLKDAEVGEVVSPNSQGGSNARGSVCTMVDFESLEVQAEVPETSLSAVRLDAPARIFLDAYPEVGHDGHVARIWPTANRQKATVEVRIRFDVLQPDFRPEMGVRVVFLEGDVAPAASEPSEPVILVPEEAVVRVDGQDGVFVVERDTVRFQAVTPGDVRSGRRVIERGLEDGARIVKAPPASLKDGDRVRVAP